MRPKEHYKVLKMVDLVLLYHTCCLRMIVSSLLKVTEGVLMRYTILRTFTVKGQDRTEDKFREVFYLLWQWLLRCGEGGS
jgi:hypothetical protein